MARSRAYPSENVVEAYEILRGSLRDLDSTPQPREALAKMLGYTSGSGGNAARKIAALVHYGFLERRNGRYALSAFGRYVRGLDSRDADWKGAIRQAFQRPALFREVLEEARAAGRIPTHLASVLEKKYEVTPGASQLVATVFTDSGLVAGVFEPDGKLKNEPAHSKVSPMPAPRLVVNEETSKPVAEAPRASRATAAPSPQSDRGSADRRKVVWSFPVPSGQATLNLELPDLPQNLSIEDFRQMERVFAFHLESLQQMSRRAAGES